MRSKYKSLIFTGGVLLFILSLFDKICWIYLCTKYVGFEETKTAYLNLFPRPIANAFFLTIADITVSGIAAVIFLESKQAGYFKNISKCLMILSAILCCWSIFSLM